MLKILILMVLVAGCVTTKTKSQKSKWKVLNSSSTAGANDSAKNNFVPTGTELIFTSSKNFSEKDNFINFELSPEKRCSLSSSDKKIDSQLEPNTVLTVVGYRGETGELVLSAPSYQQYLISCLSKNILNKVIQKRKASSVAKPSKWKKISIEMNDLQKMSPLLKVKFIPQ